MAVMSMNQPLVLAFGLLGNLISFLVFLAPIPTFLRIYKKKSTEGFQSLPYLVALFSSMLWLYYAVYKNDGLLLLITINSFGCFIETIYITLYVAYASKESRDWTIKIFSVMNMGLFSIVLVVTHFLVNGSIRVQVIGWICVVISVGVFVAPLSIVVQVIRTKSVEFMPITLSFCLTMSAFVWLAYGIVVKDICVALPNVLGIIFGLLQMLLYAVYKNKSIITKEMPQDELKTVVVLSQLGDSDTYKIVEINEAAKEQQHDQAHPQTGAATK